jgi:chromate transporter
VLAVIFGAVWALGKKAVKNGRLAVLGAVALLGAASGLPAAGVIIGLGVLGMIWQTAAGRSRRDSLPAVEPFSLGLLFAVFLKIGAILFGSGLVLVAYLQSELVDGLGWLTRAQLLDAIAIGQFTPGPVLSTATFIGYQVGGPAGALVATLGIFLPSFFFVWALNPLIPRMRQSRWMAGFLDAVNVVSIGVMAGTAGAMGWQVLDDWRGVVIAVASGVLALGPKKISTVWILAGGALLGRILWLF